MGFLIELLASIGGSIAKLLLGRWLNKDPEKEALKNAIEKQNADEKILAGPPRSKSDVLGSMRSDEIH